MQLECKNHYSLVNVKQPITHGLSVKELKDLGYKLTDNQIPLGAKPYKYGILEIKNDDNNKDVGFSMLYSVEEKLGRILPNGYSYYVARPAMCQELLR